MRRCLLLLILTAVGATGCNKPQPPLIQFYGHAPFYSKLKDNRYVQAFCPRCNGLLKWQKETGAQQVCKNRVGAENEKRMCNEKITWTEATVTCSFCKGKNVCQVCAVNRMADHKCFQCKGSGYFPPNLPCPNCGGSKVCHVCKGKGTCDFCEDGKYSVASQKAVREPGEEVAEK
jgi:hypothetical protein